MDRAKNFLYRGVHAVREARICELPTCQKEFVPIQDHQRFCCPEHRLEYFSIARRMGVAGLKELQKQKGGKAGRDGE